ncbi:DnaD domain protein [Mycoplasma sp. Z386]
MKSKYKLELEKRITDYDMEIIENFYLPIIGAKAVFLFSFLHNKVKANLSLSSLFFEIEEFIIELNMKEDKFKKSKQFLEAVGLIRTYYSEDLDEYIFLLKKPLEVETILKNKLFLNEIEKKIGQKKLEKLINKFEVKLTNTDDYEDISTSFLEVFKIDEQKISNTVEIELTKVNDNSTAKETFNTERYLNFLTKKSVKPSLVKEIDKFLVHMSQESINEVLSFCYEVNGKINRKYFITIISDLLKKEITEAKDIKNELEDALSFKKSSQTNILDLDEEETSGSNNSFKNKEKEVSENELEKILDFL